uniref:BED-type domain-containing protein n=1 Tax=Anopheles epiroticus TaxID=199890 RepID=A0A182P648_9DIPT
MPNILKANAMVWHHFIKDAEEKRGKCLYCSQSISYEKSTLSNLRRHLFRRHEEVLQQTDTSFINYERVHYVWNHFVKEHDEKARCVHCDAVLACPKNIVGNLVRHLKKKHPSQELEEEADQQTLFHPSQAQYITESMEESLTTTDTLQELELEIESELLPAELHTIDTADHSGSVKIELVADDDTEQEVIEEEIIHESQQDVEIDCEDSDVSNQYLEQYEEREEKASTQVIDEAINVTRIRNDSLEEEKVELDKQVGGRNNFFCIGMRDINIKTAVYATNIAMELESLPLRQRIIAEKLMSDVMFHAKLENLTEHTMILGKVNRPFDI